MVFIGLIGIYLTSRSDVIGSGSTWLPEGSTIPLQQPNTMFMTLLMTVVTMQWAVSAISKNDRVNAYLALGLTLMLGIATIVMTTYLWTMALRALGGQFTARQHDGITAAAVYWYAMVAVYALIWISIYVTK